jgi:hypothetical protein
MYDVVQCITDIAREVPEVLELPKHGGYKGRGKLLFPLVPSTTEQGLYANAKKWLPGVVDAAIDEESQLATRDAVTTFVKVLATIDPQAFHDICKTKYREEHQKIDPLLQKALVYDAKLVLKWGDGPPLAVSIWNGPVIVVVCSLHRLQD